MQVETNKLMTVSNYARSIDKSIGWIYRLIDNGKIECIIINGVKFIKIN